VYWPSVIHRQVILSCSADSWNPRSLPHSRTYCHIARALGAPAMSGIQVRSSSASCTVRTFLRRLGTSAYTSNVISWMDLPSTHRSSQKRADSPLPTTIEVDAAKMSSSTFENYMSNPRHALRGSVRILHSQRTLRLVAIRARSGIPNPPRLSGLHTLAQFTWQLPPLVSALPIETLAGSC
jgi:hypothetical protein